MPTVSSNSAATFALNSMTSTERDMTSAMERLSSGKRINHAGDDAAGAAQTTGKTQAKHMHKNKSELLNSVGIYLRGTYAQQEV